MNGKRTRLLLPVLLVLLIPLRMPGIARGEDSAEPRIYNKGLQLGWGWGASRLDLDLDGRELLPADQRSFDAWANGVDLICGIGFGPNFRTEFTVYFESHDSPTTDYNTYCGGIRFDGVFTLKSEWVVQPELIAGMGWGGLIYETDETPDHIYGWLQGNMGAGARWRLGDRWSLDGQYVYSILDVERELISDIDGEDEEETRFVGGDGRLHRVSLRLVYDF